jgi:CubicO group peptidase (beta-lactamase class C family)
MKKLLGILVLGLLLIYFVALVPNNAEAKPDWSKCDQDEDYKPLYCYGNDGKLLSKNERKIIKKEKLVTIYKRSSIPEKANPNYKTLVHYLLKYKNDENKFGRYEAKGSKNPYQFKSDLREDKYIKKQMQKTALLSYLLFEDGKIVIDEISPEDRFGKYFNNETRWTSASMGKSLVSYITGHAICGGYIDSVDSRLDDWPLIKNTLYEGQKLINLLNMSAGDQKYSGYDLKTTGITFSRKGKQTNPNNAPLKHHMEGFFKNSKKSKSKYNYSNIVPNIIINYVWFKSKGDFQKILDEAFKEKAKIKNTVFFLKINPGFAKDEDGPGRYSFRADRYDYLRIAKAIMNDWQNDTCVGKYLKTIYERRINKNAKHLNPNSSNGMAKGYAGFFHANYSGIKKRPVMGMAGYGGQFILIDFERGRIVAILAIHNNYNWKKIAHSVIKKGK